eukprot:2834658-Rhodomonas_salina.1
MRPIPTPIPIPDSQSPSLNHTADPQPSSPESRVSCEAKQSVSSAARCAPWRRGVQSHKHTLRLLRCSMCLDASARAHREGGVAPDEGAVDHGDEHRQRAERHQLRQPRPHEPDRQPLGTRDERHASASLSASSS